MASTFERYLEQIGRIPLLTPAEEIHLATQVQRMIALEEQQSGLTKAQQRAIRIGHRAKQRMVTANLRLVVSLARKYIHSVTHLTLDDIVQNGNIGLVRAVERFDPTRGYKFSTYAYWWIRQAITREIENCERTIRIPIHCGEALRAIRKATGALMQQNGAMPSTQEISIYTGLSVQRIEESLALSQPVTAIDGLSHVDGSPIDSFACVEDDADDNVTQHLNADYVRGLMVVLGDRDRRIMELYYGFGHPDGTGQSMNAISKSFGISRERISTCLKRGHTRLRAAAQVAG